MARGNAGPMRIVQSCLVVLLVAALLVSWSWAGGQARRVILMIGDGMGPAQVGLVLDYLRLVKGEPANMEKLAQRGNTGYMTTNPLGALVTDSAASASALATGRIYENGVISWSEDGGDVVTVLERAHAARKAVGLVTTTRLTHATPAAFAAHSLSRNTEDVIARHELVRNRIDVLLGGGSRHFEGLVDTAAMLGYTVVRTAEELRELDLSRCDKVLGLFAEGHMAYEIDRAGTDEPSLAEMTEAALARLDCDREGFFLVVEGGRIDHACHDNDAGTTLRGLLAFDEAVGVALAYADRHRGTLLLVTADHETGGMGVSPAPPNGGDGSDYQTGYGGSDRLALLGSQTSSFARAAWERDSLTAEAIRQIILDVNGLDIGIAQATWAAELEERPFFGASRSNLLGWAVGPSMQVTWASSDHTATPVLIFGTGPRAERFRGIHHVSEVGRLLFQVMDLKHEHRLGFPWGDGSESGRKYRTRERTK